MQVYERDHVFSIVSHLPVDQGVVNKVFLVYFPGKSRFGASVIRRTASLDTLYHKGQWSRDYYQHASQLQIDKSTQVRIYFYIICSFTHLTCFYFYKVIVFNYCT